MPKLIAFTQVTLDGYFAATDGDIRWAHKAPDDAEWNAFVAGNATGGGALLFGRITYELMASFWPTPQAMATLPDVARQMNQLPKIVLSRTLGQTPTQTLWSNTRLVSGDLADEVRKLKQQPGADMAILGSASIVAQLAEAGLIDEFQIVVNPIVLGGGRTLFAGINHPLNLKLTKSRVFGNGNVLLCYAPAA